MIRRKIIMYLRKSRTDNQFESVDEVVARHEKILQDFALKYLGEPITAILKEVVSGETISERPMMLHLLNEVENGDVEAVLCVEPQRLSRGSFGEIDRIVRTFMYCNTKIITPTKTYDLNNKFDRKYFEQELLRGNDYLEYVKEILVRGRKQSVEEGLYIGSVPPYGYDKKKLAKKGFTLVPNADAESVKYIFEQFIGGLGTTNLAKHLIEIGMKSHTGKQWTPAMVRNILMNRLYIGYVSYGRRETKKAMKNAEIVKSRPVNDDYIEAKGLHPAIISEEVFNKAQELLKATPAKNIRGDKSIKNPLAGLVKCKYCGNNMFRRPYDKREKPTLICKTIGCKCVSSDLDLVEKRVIDLLAQTLQDYQYYIDNYAKEHSSNAKILEKQIKKLEKELATVKTDLQNALIKYNKGAITDDEYIFLRNYTLNEENRLKGQIEALESKMQTEELENKRQAVPILENCIKEYYNLNIEERHQLLKTIIDNIIYSKEKGGRWDAEALHSFTLELNLKI